MIQLDLIKWIS